MKLTSKILLLTIIPIGILIVMYFNYRANKESIQKEFFRKFSSGMTLEKVMGVGALKNVSNFEYYSDKLYLGSDSFITEVDTSGEIIGQYRIPATASIHKAYWYTEHDIHILDLQNSVLYRLNNHTYSDSMHLSIPYAYRGVFTDSSHCLLRTKDDDDGENWSIKLYDLTNKESIQVEKQNRYDDAGFKNDGFLMKHWQNKYFGYVLIYSGGYYIIDQSGKNIEYRKTIDGNTTLPKVKKTGGSYTLGTYSRVINSGLAMNDQCAMIMSNIISAGENKTDRGRNTTIDFYDIKSGEYVMSKYIPPYQDHKVVMFVADNTFIYCIQGTSLIKYRI